MSEVIGEDTLAAARAALAAAEDQLFGLFREAQAAAKSGLLPDESGYRFLREASLFSKKGLSASETNISTAGGFLADLQAAREKINGHLDALSALASEMRGILLAACGEESKNENK